VGADQLGKVSCDLSVRRFTSVCCTIYDSLTSRHDSGEFAKPVSSKGICIDDINLSSDDLEMYIDLAPFLNPSPYIVPEDMSLTKVCHSKSIK